MKTSYNSSDGFYFFLLFISIALSFWLGDFLRIKIQSSNWNHKLSIFTGAFVEVLTMIVGVFIGFLLVKILSTTT
jgi:hypothetical protein